MSQQSPEPEVDEPLVEWMPLPDRLLAKAVARRAGQEPARELRRVLRALRGSARLQDDSKDQTWIVVQEPVLEALARLYRELELIAADFNLSEAVHREGLLRIALREEASPLDASDWPAALAQSRSLVDDTATAYGLGDVDFVERWGQAYVLHAIDYISGLEGLVPERDPEEVLSFLRETTRLLRARSEEESQDGSPVLEALEQVFESGGHRRARRTFLQALGALDKEAGRGSRLRQVPLKGGRKAQAVQHLKGILTGAGRGQRGRKLRRKASGRRSARTRARSRRLANWSASTVRGLPDEVRKALRQKVSDAARPSPAAKAAEVAAQVDETERSQAAAPGAGAVPTARELARKARRREEREKEARRERRKKRVKQRQRAGTRSARLATWSCSGEGAMLSQAARAALKAKYEARIGAAEAAPKADEEAATPKARKRRRDVSAEGARRKRKKRSKTHTSGRIERQSRRLAAFSAEDKAGLKEASEDELDAYFARKAAQRKQGGETAAPEAIEEVEEVAGKAPVVAPKPKKGRRKKRAGATKQAARAGRKKRKVKSQLGRQSQRLATWSASREMPAVTPEALAAVEAQGLTAAPAETTEASPAAAPEATPAPTGEALIKDKDKGKDKRGKSGEARRRRGKPAKAQSPTQQIALLAGAVVGLLMLAFIISKIDFNADQRGALEREVAALSSTDGYARHKELYDRAERYYDRSEANIDQAAATDMMADISGRIKAAVGKLRGRVNTIEVAPLDSASEREQAQSLLNDLRRWAGADDKLEQSEATLRDRLASASAWAGFGDAVASLAKEQAGSCRLELHAIIAAEQASPEDRELLETFRAGLDAALGQSVKAVLSHVSEARYHPVFTEAGYARLAARAKEEVGREGLEGDRLEAANRFKLALSDLEGLARSYEKVMTEAYQRLEAEDLNGARATIQRVGANKSPWLQRSLAWLSSPAAEQWVALMQARRQPDRPDPEVVARREQPSQPEAAEPNEKAPVASVQEDQPRTYKEEFALLLEQYKRAKDGAQDIIVKDMARVMGGSLELLKDSPAMARDVVAFYEARKSKFKGEAELTALFDEHVKQAWGILLPATTGPSGFLALRDWCKDTGYREGLSELEPILKRLGAPDNRNGIFQRQLAHRSKTAEVKATVEDFISKRRVANVKGFRKLLEFCREEGFQDKAFEGKLRDGLEKVIAKVGRDTRMARGLLEEYQAIPKKAMSDSEVARVASRAESKLDKILSEAEDDLIDGVQKALKAREPAVGYDLLQEALVIAPQSERAFKGLKYEKVDGEYIRPWDAKMRGRGLSYDEAIGWHKGDKQPGKYYDLKSNGWKELDAANQAHADANNPWVLESEHFVLKSTAPLDESQLVLRRLEAFYLQLFRQFDLFFAPNGDALVVFGLATKKPMVVNYYRDRAQFQAHANPPTDWAAGFYSGGAHASFFYSTPGDWTVLQHEIVHQILGENAAGYAESWLAEGTAVYMENAFFDSDQRLQLGGVSEHQRPYRYLMEAQAGRTTISYSEVLALKDGGAWGAGNVSDHYKGAGAVVYFFMTFDGGRYRCSFLNYLRDCYNRGQANALEHYFGLSQEALEWLFNRFYKQGFGSLNGKLLPHEEKEIYDRERIARLFPEPDLEQLQREAEASPKPAEPAEGGTPETPSPSEGAPKEYDEAVKDLLRTLTTNPSIDRRHEAAQALAQAGDAGKAALAEGLAELIEKARDAVEKQVSRSKGKLRSAAAVEIIKRRKEAYDFIMDPAKYPDENHGKAAQPDVDKLVAALRQAYETPSELVVPQDDKLSKLIERLNLYFDWKEQLLGAAPEREPTMKAIAKGIDETLGMDKLGLTRDDEQVRQYNLEVLAYNAKAKTSMDEEELACITITNEYRMMFGLQALRVFDPLARAARGHSQEMRKLGFFDHTSPTPANRSPAQRCSREGAKYSGENIAKGYNSGVAAYWGWYNSSGHHRNMLAKNHRSIGVGRDGSLWTENFGLDNPQ